MSIEPFVTALEDSRRWQHVRHRVDDIVISTPPKSGTTWTQGIVSSLLWPRGDAPGTLGERSPWVDSRLQPLEDTMAALEAQTHRRFMKTHSPATGFEVHAGVRYLAVYRDAPDSLVSWGNHRATFRPEIVEVINALAEVDGLPTMALRFDGDYEQLFEEWSQFCSPARHLARWWPVRTEPNVLLLHYTDLTADLPGQMRTIAEFLELDIPVEAWPDVVQRCSLEAMRTAAADGGRMDRVFEGGADAFFYRGGVGRGHRELSDVIRGRCREHCEALLPADAVAWLEVGSGSCGQNRLQR